MIKKKSLLLRKVQQLNDEDSLLFYRSNFSIPAVQKKEVIYFCGNSLGLQPLSIKTYINRELDDWANMGVDGHFHAASPWYNYHQIFSESLSKLAGARQHEVVAMNALTVNLHLLFATFYKPTGQRYKILIESPAFSSDYYAVESQLEFHGYNTENALIEVKPRPGEYTLHTEDILKAIEENKDHLALVWMGGVNYYTGQVFDMKTITEKAHEAGALSGFDLAHAIGNIVLKLHDWKVDFATWCSYKYLNSGPGGVSGIFIHESNTKMYSPAFKGWWGTDENKRFKMSKEFVSSPGADAWQLSNAPILSMAAHRAALAIFDECGMDKLRVKSEKMTALLLEGIDLIKESCPQCDLTVITPLKTEERGCQVSLVAPENGKALFEALQQNGVVADWREPDVIRVAPAPLYNTFLEVYEFLAILERFYKDKP